MSVRRSGSIAVAAIAASAVLPLGTAHAGSPAGGGVPFTDPYANGFVALCDAHGNAITAGQVDAHPFVAKAVSSFAPPASFQGDGQNAALTIYQPRQGVDPADWNGDQLTAASFYRNRKLPATQGTPSDISLATIVKEFPPAWDGFYELRMTFGKLGYANYFGSYPAAVIKVTGSSWTLVRGGSLSCGSAPAVSTEKFAPHAKPVVGKSNTGGAATAGRPGSGPTSAAGSAPAGPTAGSATSTAPAHHDHSLLVWLLAGSGLLAVATGGFLWWRRRHHRDSTLSAPPAQEALSPEGMPTR